jgi:hypothetical protein
MGLRYCYRICSSQSFCLPSPRIALFPALPRSRQGSTRGNQLHRNSIRKVLRCHSGATHSHQRAIWKVRRSSYIKDIQGYLPCAFQRSLAHPPQATIWKAETRTPDFARDLDLGRCWSSLPPLFSIPTSVPE